MKENSTAAETKLRDAFKLTNTPPGMDASDNEITPLEEELLNTSGDDDEERELKNAALDNTDSDGERLNENTTGDLLSGSELDVPGSEDDDYDEEIGEEDEENNSYSLGADKED